MRTNISRSIRTVLAAALVVAVLAGVAPAWAQTGGDNGAGGLRVRTQAQDGATVTGACFEVWTSTGPGSTDVVDQVREGLCDTNGDFLVSPFPLGHYVLIEIHPPTLRVPTSGPSESHIYLPASDAPFSLDPNVVTQLTLSHSIGAAIDIVPTLPDGSVATGSCFEARTIPAAPGGLPASGALVDEACVGTGSVARLYVPQADIHVAQITGPAGYSFAAGRQVIPVTDAVTTVAVQLTPGHTLQIIQKDEGDGIVVGGCYDILDTSGQTVDHSCDTLDAAGPDGVVVLDTLQPGSYLAVETVPPEGYQLNATPLAVNLNEGSVTVENNHQRGPRVFVHVKDPTGATVEGGTCVLILAAEGGEGSYGEGCDGPDGLSDGDGVADGTLMFIAPLPGAYLVWTTIVPPGYDYPAEPSAFTMEDGDVHLTIILGGGVTNRPPLPADDAATIAEDTPVTIDVLTNDSDPDGDTLTITEVGTPAHGTAVSSPGGITYTPAADWSGQDGFTYTVNDGRRGSAAASVVVTVAGVNDAPAASDDTANAVSGTSVVVAVVINDTDIEGDPLSPSIVTAPANGTATVRPDGSVEYRSALGFVGEDTFTYRASDGQSLSAAAATVRIHVQPDPRGCTIVGTDGDDNLVGTAGDDVICGLDGNDTIDAGAGDDTVHGDDGDDVILGGDGKDLLNGGNGDDRIDGGPGRNTVSGGPGTDACRHSPFSSGCESRF